MGKITSLWAEILYEWFMGKAEGRRRVVEAQEASLGHIAVTQRVEVLKKRAV